MLLSVFYCSHRLTPIVFSVKDELNRLGYQEGREEELLVEKKRLSHTVQKLTERVDQMEARSVT